MIPAVVRKLLRALGDLGPDGFADAVDSAAIEPRDVEIIVTAMRHRTIVDAARKFDLQPSSVREVLNKSSNRIVAEKAMLLAEQTARDIALMLDRDQTVRAWEMYCNGHTIYQIARGMRIRKALASELVTDAKKQAERAGNSHAVRMVEIARQARARGGQYNRNRGIADITLDLVK